MHFLSHHSVACLLSCWCAVGAAAQLRHEKDNSTSNCTTFPVVVQQTSGWAYCFETPALDLTLIDPQTNQPKTYKSWYQERAGLEITGGCSGRKGCNKNVRVCLKDPSGIKAEGVHIPETGGVTGPGECSTFFVTAHKCDTLLRDANNVCCVTKEECPTYTVSVIVNGPGRVKDVRFGGRRIDCPGACSSLFGAGDWSVSIAAQPDTGAVFAGWGGACAGTAATCVVGLFKGDQVITANFVSRNCTTDGDCRLFSDHCDTCNCLALPRSQPDPVCKGRIVACLVDPCRDKVATCVNGTCQVDGGGETVTATTSPP